MDGKNKVGRPHGECVDDIVELAFKRLKWGNSVRGVRLQRALSPRFMMMMMMMGGWVASLWRRVDIKVGIYSHNRTEPDAELCCCFPALNVTEPELSMGPFS